MGIGSYFKARHSSCWSRLSRDAPTFLRVTKDQPPPPVEIQKMSDFCQSCGQNWDTDERLAKALASIKRHNDECDRLCDDRKHCGYSQYREYMCCPNCPKNWKLL